MPIDLYTKFPPFSKIIVSKLHSTLKSFNPNYEIKKAWSGVGYKSGKNYSCVVHAQKDHVQLMIMRGIMLNDPKKLLKGTGINTRHLKFYSAVDVDSKYIIDLLDQQADLFAKGIKWEG